MFLKIENDGVAPVEGFTMLGLSTARGNSNSIGQFGSGNKHAVNLLLRNKMNPIIYLGKNRLKFSTINASMGDKAYQKVCYEFQGKKQELSFCLEFGELDWQGVDMALREFVSNAIDAVDGKLHKMSVKMVDNIQPSADKTSIYIEANDVVCKFFNQLKSRFLHFSAMENANIISKDKEDFPKIYRKGVFVREISPDYLAKVSLFDYNFGDELPIDESRQANDWQVSSACATKFLTNKHALEVIFKAMKDGKETFETTSQYVRDYLANHDLIKECWQKVFGNTLIASTRQVVQLMSARNKNSVCPLGNWYNLLSSIGIQTAESVLSKVEENGGELLPPSVEGQQVLDKVWAKFCQLNMTNGKTKPQLMLFSKCVENGQQIFGYYKEGVVYISVDFVNNLQTYVEELIHHVSEATDYSREFQEASLQFATRAAFFS